MALLPITQTEKAEPSQAHVFHAHAASVTDWHFSDFDSDLLATGGEDGMVKLWKVSHEDIAPTSQLSFATSSRRVDLVRFHPTADNILTTLGNDGKKISIWDLTKSVCAFDIEKQSTTLQSFSWKLDGSLLATSGQNRIDIWDPRADTQLIATGGGHAGIKGHRVVYLGQSNYVFSLGMNKMRNSQYMIWDHRNMSSAVSSKSLNSSASVIVPLYDQDTETMHLISRGTNTLRTLQLSHTDNNPIVEENLPCGAGATLYGGALLPKQTLDVMQAEIARVVAVTDNAIIPVPFKVPRKSYLDFHADLYPPTKSQEPSLSGAEWLQGKNEPIKTMSLDPSRRQNSSQGTHTKPAAAPEDQVVPTLQKSSTQSTKPTATTTPETLTKPAAVTATTTETATKEMPVTTSQEIKQQIPIEKSETKHDAPQELPTYETTTAVPQNNSNHVQEEAPKEKLRPKPKFGSTNQSTYKFISSKVCHPSTHYEHLHDLSVDKGDMCDLIQANTSWIAVPMAGPGGRVGIIAVSKPGRLPTRLASFQCGSTVVAMQFDPFDESVLAIASEDSRVRLFRIPDEGLEEDNENALAVFHVDNMEKLTMVRFHPTAKDVLAITGGSTIHLWDVSKQKEHSKITVDKSPVTGIAWSPDGTRLAVATKNKKLRVIDARTKVVLTDGSSHNSLRPSRIVWLDDSGRLASVGFGQGSMREVLLFDTNLDIISRAVIDMSPSAMQVHYDPDCQLLFAAGKGDRLVHTFDCSQDNVVTLPKLEFGTLQQGLAFFPKRLCDVRSIEIERFFRLTTQSIEVVSVRVPRAMPTYFQDDIFVDTVDTEHTSLTSEQWFQGENTSMNHISLCPDDMTPVSLAPPPPQVARSKEKFEQGKREVSEEEKRREVMERMFSTAKDVSDDEAPAISQKIDEVDDDEWDA